ncbi:MAG: hypothetical protein EBU88_15970, partial [Acidobacteria bacterium]|nr:hypothetical protein [Acidobacteriota bacterium]
GVDVVTATVSNLTLNMNRAGGTLNGTAATATADFEAAPLANTVGGQSSTLDFKGNLLRATALIEFGVSGFANVRGRVGIEFGDMDVKIAGYTGPDLPTKFIKFWGIDVDASIGINGPAWSNTDFTGFEVAGLDFNLMLNMRNPLSAVLPDLGSMKWFTLKAALPEITFAPFLDFKVPDLNAIIPTLSLNLTYDVPALSTPTPWIDYSATLPDVALPALPAMQNFPGLPALPAVPAIPSFAFTVPPKELLEINNLPAIDLFDFLAINGSLTVKRTEYTATLNDGTSVPAWALVINSVNGGFFAGFNGPATNSDATGLAVNNVNGALAVLIPKDASDKRRWVAASGTGNSVALLGLPELTMSASNIAVELNQPLGTNSTGSANTSVVNFTGNALSVLMDDGSTVNISHPGSSGALLKVAANATVGIADFFSVSGNFGIQSSTRSVTLSDGSSVDAQILTIGGTNVSGFAGVNGGTANAAGLSLTGVDFGFATAVDLLNGDRRWNTLQATAATVAALGIPDVTISGSNLAVSINRPDLNGVVASYSGTPLSVPLGGGQNYQINLNGATGALLEASGTLTVTVNDFFHVTGSFALRRAAANVTLADGTTADVTLLTLGIDGGTAFVGLAGGTADAAGLTITNA